MRTALALSSVMFVTSGIQFVWIRLFVAAWGLQKAFVVQGLLISTGLGGAVGVVVGPKAIDWCGDFDKPQGRTRSLRLISCMMLLAALGASGSLAALFLQYRRLQAAGPTAHYAGWGQGDSLLYAAWFGVFVIFAAFNGTVAGLTGLNVSALDSSLWSIGSGFTVSMQNLLGYSMGPLLPGLVMDILRQRLRPQGQAELLLLGFGLVLSGTALALLFALGAASASRALEREAEQSDEDCTNFEKPLLDT